MAAVFAGRRFRGTAKIHAATLPILAVMVLLFLRNGDPGRRLPPYLIEHPDAPLTRDAQLAPLYPDPELANYRIFFPTEFAKTFSAALGFRKIVHTYCCRQYLDDLRIAFGLVNGPEPFEITKYYVSMSYNHPFWKLYNVRYIVDDFGRRPELLPADPGSYERLSDLVIRLKETKELAYFLEDYSFIDQTRFLHTLLADADGSILEKVYLHDAPERTGDAAGRDRGPARVVVREGISGRMRAEVSAPGPGFLVFSEIWAPSWHVYVDGKEEKSLRAYGMLQAVQVGPGRHEVLFEYDVFASWKMKVALAACAVALLIAGAALRHRLRTPHPAHRADGSAVPGTEQ